MSDGESKPETKKPPGAVARICLMLLGLFFWLGDRALRQIWHFSFFASVMIWAGGIGVFLIGGLIYMHFRDE
ncbi:MAG TPA: hypothetical protein VHZ25_04690 [Acidobacteriaceae bacterium]|jgi:hypothetical protein|nr:hypothetical protein [Acidobacteriaceae bacterium]